MSQARWYFKCGDGERGPFTAHQLQQMTENGKIQPASLIRKGNRKWEEAGQVAFLAELFGGGGSNAAQCRDRDAALSEFIPNFNPGDYEEDCLEVFSHIVMGINRLREMPDYCGTGESRPFTLNLNQRDWDADSLSVLSQIEHTIEQLWAAIEKGESLPSADYVLKFDASRWHKDTAEFMRRVESALNGLRKRQQSPHTPNSYRTPFALPQAQNESLKINLLGEELPVTTQQTRKVWPVVVAPHTDWRNVVGSLLSMAPVLLMLCGSGLLLVFLWRTGSSGTADDPFASSTFSTVLSWFFGVFLILWGSFSALSLIFAKLEGIPWLLSAWGGLCLVTLGPFRYLLFLLVAGCSYPWQSVNAFASTFLLALYIPILYGFLVLLGLAWPTIGVYWVAIKCPKNWMRYVFALFAPPILAFLGSILFSIVLPLTAFTTHWLDARDVIGATNGPAYYIFSWCPPQAEPDYLYRTAGTTQDYLRCHVAYVYLSERSQEYFVKKAYPALYEKLVEEQLDQDSRDSAPANAPIKRLGAVSDINEESPAGMEDYLIFNWDWVRVVMVYSLAVFAVSSAILIPSLKLFNLKGLERLPTWLRWVLVLPTAFLVGQIAETVPRLLFAAIEITINHHLTFEPGFACLVWQAYYPLFFVVGGMKMAPAHRFGVFVALGGLKIAVAIFNFCTILNFVNQGGEWDRLSPLISSPLWWDASVYVLCTVLLVALGVYSAARLPRKNTSLDQKEP